MLAALSLPLLHSAAHTVSQCSPAPPSGQPGCPSSATPCFAPYSTVSSSSCQRPATPHSAAMNIPFFIYWVSKRTVLDPKKNEHFLPKKTCGVSAVEPGAWMCISLSAAPTRPGSLILATQALPLPSYCSQSGRRKVTVV